MSDETAEAIEKLIYDTVEELIVLRIHMGNDETEEMREKIKQAQINLFAISEICRKETT